MNLYDIYRDQTGKTHLVKSGFSSCGFCLVWLCCCLRGMVWIAALQCVAWLLLLWMAVSFWGNWSWLHTVTVFADLAELGPYAFRFLSILSVFSMLLLHLYVGVFCNQWTRTKWQHWGWERVSNVLASSLKAAKQQVGQDPGRQG